MPAFPETLAPHAVLRDVALLTCDVDGVMTDGGLYYGDSGERSKRFHVLDGQGMKELMRAGVTVCFVTQSRNLSIVARARDLGVDHCFTGIDDKRVVIEKLAAELGISLSRVAHIADDVNDLSLLSAVGVPVTVPNGVPAVHRVCRFVTKAAGGHGAVRELCEAIIASRAIID